MICYYKINSIRQEIRMSRVIAISAQSTYHLFYGRLRVTTDDRINLKTRTNAKTRPIDYTFGWSHLYTTIKKKKRKATAMLIRRDPVK